MIPTNLSIGRCLLLLLFLCQCPAVAQRTPFRMSGKITSPNPNRNDFFGEEVVVVGETIAVSSRADDTFSPNGGAVYLYNESGTLLRWIASPNSQEAGWFGFYMTAVGTDKLLIGADFEDEKAGNAYLFNIDGTLIKELTSPNREEGAKFGGRFLLSNSESLFVASWTDKSVGTNGGAVYEYDLDGELVNTFVSPRPDTGRCFGRAGTFVGDDKILISDVCDETSGENAAGAAFLFDLDGRLLETLDNPNPAVLDQFGTGLAYANGRILIGGVQIDDLATRASSGAAYIFELDGELVTRVSDPEPKSGNWFGWNAGSFEFDDNDTQFIVGSIFNSTEFYRAGKIFFVNEDGEITQQLSSPEPGRQEQFGASFTQFGDKLLVGETQDGGGFPNGTGAVWIFEPAELGDFDLDGNVDLPDLEILCDELASGEITQSWDITGDELVDHQDLAMFLELTARLPGDADFDGEVSFADFLTLSSNFGDPEVRSWSAGNFDCSGHVQFADFLTLSKNFGKAPITQAVPEPTSNVFLHLLVGMLAYLRGFCTSRRVPWQLSVLHRRSRGDENRKQC